MKQESDILNKIGTEPGFKVPDGYFDNFKKQMSEALPERKFEPEAAPSKWLRIRPWVYMAAMFAGVWCMMQIFADMKKANSRNLGFNPEIADAMQDEKFVDEYMMIDNNISDYDLLNELYQEGIESNIFDSDSISFNQEK